MKKLFPLPVVHDRREKMSYRWQTAFATIVLFVLGSIMNIPFSRELKRLNIEAGQIGIKLNESILDDVLLIGGSSFVLGVILVFFGYWISAGANLGAPVLTRIFSRKSLDGYVSWRIIGESVGLAGILAVFLLGVFELQKEFYPIDGIIERPAKPFYALVAFSAGISEEVMFRLGLMSFIIALIQLFKKTATPSPTVVWVAIIISAIFFGLIHLPLSKNFVELTPFTIGVTMVGNLMTGTLFGLIYWKRGLLVAIVAHIAFDLIFHVVGSPYA